jgi:hypothetical protein
MACAEMSLSAKAGKHLRRPRSVLWEGTLLCRNKYRCVWVRSGKGPTKARPVEKGYITDKQYMYTGEEKYRERAHDPPREADEAGYKYLITLGTARCLPPRAQSSSVQSLLSWAGLLTNHCSGCRHGSGSAPLQALQVCSLT